MPSRDHPPSELLGSDMDAFANSAFSPNHQYFAALTLSVNAYRLRVWETASHQLISDFTGQEGDECISLSWSDLTLALGLKSGTIDLFSIAQKSIIGSLKNGHKSLVNDFVFDGGRGYSVSEDGSVCEWDIETLECIRSVQTHAMLKKISLSPDRSILAVAGHQIKIYKMANLSLLHTFTGHSTDVKSLFFTSDNRFCISTADQERALSVWDCQDLSRSNCYQLLSMDADIQRSAISSVSDTILALDEHGQMKIWDGPLKTLEKPKNKKSKQTSKGPIGSLKIVSDQDDQVMVPIYSATFADEQIMIVRGSIVRPVFELLAYLDKDSCIKEESIFQRSPIRNMLAHESKGDTKTKQMDTSKMSVKSGSNFQLSQLNQSLEERTIEEKLQEITMEPTGMPLPKHQNVKINAVSSLHQMLTQAVTSGDSELLERCLRVRDPKMISSTVQRLSSATVLPLMELVVKRLQLKPARGIFLIEWIRASLIYHASYLMSVPDLVQNLSTLYRSLEARVSSFEKMLKLSGRLDVIMCQSNLRNGQIDDEEEALATYHEEEEDEGEMDEDEFSDEDADASLEETDQEELSMDEGDMSDF